MANKKGSTNTRERSEPLLKALVANALVAKKARDIRALYVGKLVAYTDFFLICSGQSELHVRAIARQLIETGKSMDWEPISVEGTRFNRWVLVDFGDVMVHIFLDSLRGVYELERLWTEAENVELDLPRSAPAFWEDSEDDLLDDLPDDASFEETDDPSVSALDALQPAAARRTRAKPEDTEG